jgi:hypothetical protein
VKITGTFDLIMTADPDSESRGPEEIVLYEGDFELEN